jgi:hypothetical protein
MERKRPGNGLAKSRSIRAEIKLALPPIFYNYLILNNISTLIECTYYPFRYGDLKFADYEKKYVKKAGQNNPAFLMFYVKTKTFM